MEKIIISKGTEKKNLMQVFDHIETLEHKTNSVSIIGFDYGDYEIKYSIFHNKFGYTISSVRI